MTLDAGRGVGGDATGAMLWQAWHTFGVDRLRRLPSVDELIRRHQGRLPRLVLATVIRGTLEAARTALAAEPDVDVESMVETAVVAATRRAGVPLINATGVILHTNMGRAAWSEEAVRRAVETARHATDLELDLTTGERGRRGSWVGELLSQLTGCEASLVVNNNAAAVLLALAASSKGRAVPVSRGELIEIGGAYRLPEVMEASGARLVEVGTTNRTRVDDYRTALQVHDCGAILKVHPSNYRVDGFAETPGVHDLGPAAAEAGVPLIYDIGSGLLARGATWMPAPLPEWLRHEPGARESLAEGADLVTFSGDKLLGGPQCGIIIGRGDLIARLRGHPMARAVRVDGVTLAALAATLEAYADDEVRRLPFWETALSPADEIAERAERIAEAVGAEVRVGTSSVGGGSAPGATLPTTLVWLGDADEMFERLLAHETPVVGRRFEGALVLDPRTVAPSEDETLIRVVLECRS